MKCKIEELKIGFLIKGEIISAKFSPPDFPMERVSRGHKMVEVFGPKSPTKGECMRELVPIFLQDLENSKVLSERDFVKYADVFENMWLRRSKILSERGVIILLPPEVDLNIIPPNQPPVLCAGDDVTDESMFQTELSTENGMYKNNIVDIVSVKVGEGKTCAKFRVNGPSELRRLLQLLIFRYKNPAEGVTI
jgi:trehalose-phosphatase